VKPLRSGQRARLLLAIALGGIGTLGVLSVNASPRTPGMHADAVQYVAAATSFARGGLFTIPVASWRAPLVPTTLSHFPPGFPALIALPISLGIRPITAALWVIALSAGVAVAFAFLLGDRISGWLGGLVGAALLLVTPGLVRLHLAVWSEPTYLALTLALLYTVARAPRRSVAHGVVAAAGLAVRYVGIAGTATAVLWAVVHARSGVERMRRAGLAAAPSLLLVVWWMASSGVGGGAVRRPGWYPHVGRNLAQLDDLAVDWLVPGTLGGGIRMALLILLAAAWVVGLAKRDGMWRGEEASTVARCSLLYVCCYGVVLLGSRLLLDPAIPFDVRLFSPVLVLATIGLGVSAGWVMANRGYLVAGVVAAGLVVWVGFAGAYDRAGVRAVNRSGLYYTQQVWVASPLVRWIREHPTRFETTYSDEPELFHFFTGRHATRLPRTSERGDLEAFRAAFAKTPGPVVLFNPQQPEDLSEKSVIETIEVRPVVRTDEGVVLMPGTGR
jgi:hypothetical protein